jgi:hypothetical protein
MFSSLNMILPFLTLIWAFSGILKRLQSLFTKAIKSLKLGETTAIFILILFKERAET